MVSLPTTFWGNFFRGFRISIDTCCSAVRPGAWMTPLPLRFPWIDDPWPSPCASMAICLCGSKQSNVASYHWTAVPAVLWPSPCPFPQLSLAPHLVPEFSERNQEAALAWKKESHAVDILREKLTNNSFLSPLCSSLLCAFAAGFSFLALHISSIKLTTAQVCPYFGLLYLCITQFFWKY